MARTYYRTCIKNLTIKEGDAAFTLAKGKKYLTSHITAKGNVIVLTKYWVSVPGKEYFKGEIPAYGSSSKGEAPSNKGEKKKNVALLRFLKRRRFMMFLTAIAAWYIAGLCFDFKMGLLEGMLLVFILFFLHGEGFYED